MCNNVIYDEFDNLSFDYNEYKKFVDERMSMFPNGPMTRSDWEDFYGMFHDIFIEEELVIDNHDKCIEWLSNNISTPIDKIPEETLNELYELFDIKGKYSEKMEIRRRVLQLQIELKRKQKSVNLNEANIMPIRFNGKVIGSFLIEDGFKLKKGEPIYG